MTMVLIGAGLLIGFVQLLFAGAVGQFVQDCNFPGAKVSLLVAIAMFFMSAVLFFCAGVMR